MQTPGQTKQRAADLYWLAFLLTERRESSADIAAAAVASQDGDGPYFSSWMLSWSRRLVIAKALAAIRGELRASARRMELKRPNKPAMPDRDWVLDWSTTKIEIENALLAIDVFPRAALVLSVFERLPIADAALLLDVEPKLLSKARTIGLRELTSNLARMQGRKSTAAKPYLGDGVTQYA
jgi:DNA-directed RNA polymerase specialized sigma24 family protein